MPENRSLATGQRPLTDESVRRPLWPPATAGHAGDADADAGGFGGPDADAGPVPFEVTYDYDAVDPGPFAGPVEGGHPPGPGGPAPGPGPERWAPLLPPLGDPDLSMGAGGTPLSRAPGLADRAGLDAAVYLKDESQNPTWSHKDRFNRVTTAAAVRADARGVACYSSGNHGASAAAYAARAGLPCVVLTARDAPPAVVGFLRAYGAAVLRGGSYTERTRLVDALADRGFHPVTSRTPVHVGHPYGPEGYKPIAYETYRQLGAVPGSVFVPTGAAELVYGVSKGFRELARLGVTDATPRMVACQPTTQAPLVEAVDRGAPATSVEAGRTAARAIGGGRSTHRGYRAVVDSGGAALAVPDAATRAARDRMAARGRWQEFSGAAGLGGLLVAGGGWSAADDGGDATGDGAGGDATGDDDGGDATGDAAGDDPGVRAAGPAATDGDGRGGDRPVNVEGPVIVLACSSGFKDGVGEAATAPAVDPEFGAVRAALDDEYGLDVPE